MTDINVTSLKQKELEERLRKLPRQKYKVIYFIALTLIGPFVLPFMPKRGGNTSDRAYEDDVIAYFVLYGIMLPVVIYYHINKVNDEIYEVKRELRELKRKSDHIGDCLKRKQ